MTVTANNMQKKNLLIIGAGIFQTYAIRVAKRMGLSVCVIDQDANAPGIRLADHHMIASTRDISQAIRCARRFRNRYGLDGVFTCGTDVSHTVASVAEALDLPGIPPETALMATDKGLMRTALKKAGVPVPDFRIVQSLSQALEAARQIGFPLVIKPVDNMGARGVRKCRSRKELETAWSETSRHSRTQRIILESFIPARELSIDTLVDRGRIHLLTIADRIISGSPFFIERGHTIPSMQPPGELQAAFAMAKKGIRALNIRTGASKFDMRLSKNGPIIGEMTARLSGGFHSQLTDPLATGMNSIKAAIDLCLGNPLDVKDITPRFHRHACERSLYPRPGRITAINGIEKAKQMKNIADIIINIKIGDLLHPLNSNIGKAGHVIGYGSTRAEAVKCTLDAVRAIHIRTQTP